MARRPRSRQYSHCTCAASLSFQPLVIPGDRSVRLPESDSRKPFLRCMTRRTLRPSRAFKDATTSQETLHRHEYLKPLQALISAKGLSLTDFGCSLDTSETGQQHSRVPRPKSKRRRVVVDQKTCSAWAISSWKRDSRRAGSDRDFFLNPAKQAGWSFQADHDEENTQLHVYTAGF